MGRLGSDRDAIVGAYIRLGFSPASPYLERSTLALVFSLAQQAVVAGKGEELLHIAAEAPAPLPPVPEAPKVDAEMAGILATVPLPWPDRRLQRFAVAFAEHMTLRKQDLLTAARLMGGAGTIDWSLSVEHASRQLLQMSALAGRGPEIARALLEGPLPPVELAEVELDAEQRRLLGELPLRWTEKPLRRLNDELGERYADDVASLQAAARMIGCADSIDWQLGSTYCVRDLMKLAATHGRGAEVMGLLTHAV